MSERPVDACDVLHPSDGWIRDRAAEYAALPDQNYYNFFIGSCQRGGLEPEYAMMKFKRSGTWLQFKAVVAEKLGYTAEDNVTGTWVHPDGPKMRLADRSDWDDVLETIQENSHQSGKGNIKIIMR